ncbi:hypothetical protein PE36_22460 [Moritella sp. PE36]|nr:hypothetical protein PE36_22460 [Moritella sp. PE36]
MAYSSNDICFNYNSITDLKTFIFSLIYLLGSFVTLFIGITDG